MVGFRQDAEFSLTYGRMCFPLRLLQTQLFIKPRSLVHQEKIIGEHPSFKSPATRTGQEDMNVGVVIELGLGPHVNSFANQAVLYVNKPEWILFHFPVVRESISPFSRTVIWPSCFVVCVTDPSSERFRSWGSAARDTSAYR